MNAIARLLAGLALALAALAVSCAIGMAPFPDEERLPLPAPKLEGRTSLEAALAERRSVRDYADTELTLEELGQLLWAAQGITAGWGGRTAPSAGATYPLVVYAVVGAVEDLAPGIYRYLPEDHALVPHLEGDLREAVARASLGQHWMADAPVSLVIAADYARTTGRYGDRGERYVHMEVGHAGQNVYLQAESLDLVTVTVGAFRDEELAELLEITEDPLAVMPVGHEAP